jgi:hypothetical protein
MWIKGLGLIKDAAKAARHGWDGRFLQSSSTTGVA